ncbi:MAG: DNA repair protein RecO [Pseudomonadales bacterium]
MARSRTKTYAAYVLHARAFRETSLMLDLFTREQGRVSAVFKGGRKGSRARARPEPFLQYHVGLFGNGDLKSIASFEIDAQFGIERLQGARLFSGLYLNELLYYLLLANVQQADVFQAYENVLLALHKTANFEAHLRNFELKLMDCLGYGLSFDLEADGLSPVRAENQYEFLAGNGFQVCSSRTIDNHAALVSGEVLLQIVRGEWSEPQVLKTLKQVNQQALQHMLKGKTLNSREIFRKSKA